MANYDVAVIGAGLGGVAAALAALRTGKRVFLSEEYDWIGGQLTSQAVPPDEHPWIEQFGCTRSYRQLRQDIRAYYRRHYPLTAQAAAHPQLNPGNGFVSTLCHEPKVSLAVLQAYLLPYLSSGQLTLLQRYVPILATLKDHTVTSVTIEHTESGHQQLIEAPYVIDATELGDVLALAGVPFRGGAESRHEFNEPSAPLEANPADVQAFSWCFVVDYQPNGHHVIDKPAQWETWRTYDPKLSPPWGSLMLSWSATHPITLDPVVRSFDPLHPQPQRGPMDLWTFRRIADRQNFRPGFYSSDIVLVNWPQIDYLEGNLIGASPHDRKAYLYEARQQALSMLYWMQTEAPRADGNKGWPGLRLRGDLTEGPDGLAMAPYIREGRRLVGLATITENHVGEQARHALGFDRAETFEDSVGIGAYRIDLHPTTAHRNYLDVGSLPFEIPLGALVGRAAGNLLAGAKNISTTHITNGCYRLHPVEWNVGEASGLLASYCLDHHLTPLALRDDPKELRSFQHFLQSEGIEIRWPELKAL